MKFRFLYIVIALMSGQAFAADISGITVKGEAGFDYNSFSSNTEGMPNSGGATHETYRFNTAQVILTKETEQIAFLGRLAYTSEEYTDSTGAKRNHLGGLDQIEVYYKVMPNLQVGFGRLLTTMGYESLMKYENAFYNTTIAYSTIVPGYGEGLRAKYVHNDYFSATVSTYNRFSYGAIGEDATATKATEASITGTAAGFTWFAGYLFGSDAGNADNSATSIWGSYKIMDNLTAAITFDGKTTKPEGGSTSFAQALSGVLTYTVGMHNFGLRYENIYGAQFIGYTAGEKIDSISITDKMALSENLNFYVEARQDTSDEEIFADKDKVPGTEKSAYMVTLGALAYF